MTNITLSIDSNIYKKMKKYSEIKWSEFVRKIIKNRIEELEKIYHRKTKESLMTMIASEDVLFKDWNKPEEDKAWENL